MADEQGTAPAARTAPVLEQLRDGWHSLGGGDAAACPGCPVCRLTESAGRLDPVAVEHLQSAAGHLAQAGREVLAALGRLSVPTAAPRPTGEPDPDPGTHPTAVRTRIPVVVQDPQDHPQQQEEHT